MIWPFVILIVLFSIIFFTRDIEKVVVPEHINLREDLYIVIHEKPQDSLKTVYYKKRK